eukprot:5655910-Pleurochrysis_carterae.AAC.1
MHFSFWTCAACVLADRSFPQASRRRLRIWPSPLASAPDPKPPRRHAEPPRPLFPARRGRSLYFRPRKDSDQPVHASPGVRGFKENGLDDRIGPRSTSELQYRCDSRHLDVHDIAHFASGP